MVIGVRAAWCEVHFWEVELPVEYLISCWLTIKGCFKHTFSDLTWLCTGSMW